MALANLTAAELSSLTPTEIDGLVSEIHSSIETSGGTQTLPEKYCKTWGILKILLALAKIFTNDETDAKIDAILEIGNASCSID